MFGGFSLISNWKYALIVVLLITIGLGKFYYEEKIEDKEQKINQLQANNLRLQQGIEDQNREIEKWKEKNRKAKQSIEKAQKKALEKRNNKKFNESVEKGSSCEKSMEWLREQANESN